MHVRVAPVLLIVAAAQVGGLAAGIWALNQPDQYRATAVVAIAPASSLLTDADVIDVVGSLDRTGIAATAAGIAESRSVRDEAAAATGTTREQLAEYDIDGVPVLGASLVDVVVSGPDADTSAALANSVVELVQARITTLYQVYQLDIITLATPPDHSTRPRGIVIVAAGTVAGAALAALVRYATVAGRRVRGVGERIAT